jgi:hypothetical protein
MVKNNIPSIAAIISHPPQRTTSSPVFVGEEGENDSDDDQYDTPWEFHVINLYVIL